MVNVVKHALMFMTEAKSNLVISSKTKEAALTAINVILVMILKFASNS